MRASRANTCVVTYLEFGRTARQERKGRGAHYGLARDSDVRMVVGCAPEQHAGTEETARAQHGARALRSARTHRQ